MSSIRIPEISYKNKIRTLLIICLIILINFIGSAQNINKTRCSISKQEALLKKKNPYRSSEIQEFKKLIDNWVKNEYDSASRSSITIPVVVHLLYNTESQNITDQQILSQIKALNQDFSRTNPDTADTPKDFLSVAGNSNIQFCLVTKDPSGNKTNGIIRKKTSKTAFTDEDDAIKFTAKGGDDSWPTTQYFNIWVCDLGDDILGYGEFPTSMATNTYGLVVNYRSFGTLGKVLAPYDKGRTSTHEVGHCLNLYHIWGDEPDCDQDDEIDDTPLQKSENKGCPVYPQKADSGGSCEAAGPSSMYMNYMDYTNDECMNMFSKQQVSRMLAVLNVKPYNALKSSNKCGGINSIDDFTDAITTQKNVSFKLYPNPGKGELNISFNSKTSCNITVTIFDIIGNKLSSDSYKNLENNSKLRLPNLTTGVYFFEIDCDGKKQIERIIINN